MFHTSIPAQSSWNPSQFADSQGFVLATRDDPRLTAYIWNPTDGLTSSFQPASDWGNEPTGLSARKQGKYIAVCSASRWSVYNFDTSTGFGSLDHDETLSNMRAIKFSPYGNLLAVATSTAVKIYNFSPTTGVGDLLQSLSTTVGAITDVDFAPDGSFFLVVGRTGDIVEVFPVNNRRNIDAFGAGEALSTNIIDEQRPGEDSFIGDKKGFCKISGRCQNGYHYYCYESDSNVIYGRIDNGVPQAPNSIWFGRVSPPQQPFGMAFVPDKNLLVVTHSTGSSNYESDGTDVRSFALTDNISYRGYESSVGSFANQLGTGNRGGLAYAATYMANYDAIVLANWDNIGNTHPLTTLTIASNGAFTEVTRPVASGSVNDGLLVDWL